MSTVGRRLLSSIVYSGSLSQYIRMGLSKELFRETELDLYVAIEKHLSKYGSIPKADTVADMAGLGMGLVEASEPPEFYLDEVERRYLHTQLTMAVAKTHDLLVDKKDDKAFEVVNATLSNLYTFKHRQHLFDFRDAFQLIKDEIKVAKSGGPEASLMFGWPSLDKLTGGLRAGDFCSYTGRPAAGKTFQLLYTAIESWKKGGVPLFISMEMNTTIVVQRLAAMHLGYSLTKLIKGEVTTAKWGEIQPKLKLLGTKEHPLWVVDGNLTTKMEDVLFLCRQLNPSSVFIDGAYLLRHSNPRLNKWDKMTDNAEMLKQQIATDIGIPVVASYQLNREVTKKKKEDKKGVEDIYGTDAIGQLSTVSLGLFQEEGVETMREREVTILKGRNGEVGKFKINWDFDKMDFSEVSTGKSKDAEDDSSMDKAYQMMYLG